MTVGMLLCVPLKSEEQRWKTRVCIDAKAVAVLMLVVKRVLEGRNNDSRIDGQKALSGFLPSQRSERLRHAAAMCAR